MRLLTLPLTGDLPSKTDLPTICQKFQSLDTAFHPGW
jgi:hypothetical protein